MRDIRFSAVPLSGTVALALGVFLFFFGIGLGLAPMAEPVTVEAEPPPLPTPARIGEAAPDFDLPKFGGGTLGLSALQGRPVILYFWTTWCRYCSADLPGLVELQRQYEAQGLTVIGVNIMESSETVAEFRSKQGQISFPIVLDPDAVVTRLYNVRAMPTYFFIDASGVVKSRIIGQARSGALQAQTKHIVDSIVIPEPPGEANTESHS